MEPVPQEGRCRRHSQCRRACNLLRSDTTKVMKNSNLFVAVRSQGPCWNLFDQIKRQNESALVASQDPDDWQSFLVELSQQQPDVLFLELDPVTDRLEHALGEVRNNSLR